MPHAEVTNNGKIAKTLLPIEVDGQQKPILHFLLDKVQALPNVNQLIVITNSLYIKDIYNSIQTYAQANNPTWSNTFTVLTDGTTKAPATGANVALQMANAEIYEQCADDILVMASDNYFEFSLVDMYYQHQSLKADYGDDVNLIACKTYPKKDLEFIANNFGILVTDHNNQITELQEKPGIQNIKSRNVSLALYMLNRIDLSLIDEYMLTAKGKARDSIGYFINYLIQNTLSFAYPIKGAFKDIGTPEEYYALAPYTSRFKL